MYKYFFLTLLFFVVFSKVCAKESIKHSSIPIRITANTLKIIDKSIMFAGNVILTEGKLILKADALYAKVEDGFAKKDKKLFIEYFLQDLGRHIFDVEASGHVSLNYVGYNITGKRVLLNLRSRIFEVQENVRIKSSEYMLKGDTLLYNGEVIRMLSSDSSKVHVFLDSMEE